MLNLILIVFIFPDSYLFIFSVHLIYRMTAYFLSVSYLTGLHQLVLLVFIIVFDCVVRVESTQYWQVFFIVFINSTQALILILI